MLTLTRSDPHEQRSARLGDRGMHVHESGCPSWVVVSCDFWFAWFELSSIRVPKVHLVVSTFTVPSMPLIDVPEAAKADALASLELNQNDVADEIKTALGHHKIRTISLFCRMASSEEAFRTWAEKKLGLDGDIEDSVANAMLTEAWSSAKGRAETQQKVDDNARAHGLPAQMLKGTYVSIRRAYLEADTSKLLRKEHTPAKCYLEARVEEMNEGELRAEMLSEVVSQKEELAIADPGWTMDLTATGSWTLKRTKVKGCLPKGTEELRAKYKLMSVHWEMIKFRHQEAAFLKDYNPDAFADVLEYLLSDEVWQLRARDRTGCKVVAPSWEALLGYEQEIRTEAIKNVNLEGTTLVTALRSARQNDRLLHFCSTLTTDRNTRFDAAAVQDVFMSDTTERSHKRIKKDVKRHKDATNHIKKDERAVVSVSKATKDFNDGSRFSRVKATRKDIELKKRIGSKMVCYAYQKPTGCKDKKKCRFEHLCAFCEGAHPFESCTACTADGMAFPST